MIRPLCLSLHCLSLLCLLLLCPCAVARAGELPAGQLRALYGLKPAAPPFVGKSPAAVAGWLVRHRFNAVFGGYRQRALVKALRGRGIKVYAEVPLFVGAKQWRRHRGSRPIDASGRAIGRKGWYAGACPDHPGLRRAKLAQIARVVRRYRVDGVWLDFIRYPARWEQREPWLPRTCFCEHTLRAFTAATKIAPPAGLGGAAARARWILRRHGARFTAFKTDRIAAFARDARRAARAVDPRVVVGLFGVPWRPGERDGALHAAVGQDFRKLAPHVDVLSPMTYHRMTGRPSGWIAKHVAFLSRHAGRPVLPVVQACSVPDRLTDAEFSAAVRAALKAPSRGVIIFSQRHFARERRAKAWRAAVEPRR